MMRHRGAISVTMQAFRLGDRQIPNTYRYSAGSEAAGNNASKMTQIGIPCLSTSNTSQKL